MRFPRTPRVLTWALRIWPPFVGAGIHVSYIAPDWRRVRVKMRLTPFNRNYVGTHFGGSLLAMCDPWFMLMTLESLGREFIVWDKKASIEFVQPGRGTVHGDFVLNDATLEEIRTAAAGGNKVLYTFRTAIKNEADEVVCRVEKVIYVRRKRPRVT